MDDALTVIRRDGLANAEKALRSSMLWLWFWWAWLGVWTVWAVFCLTVGWWLAAAITVVTLATAVANIVLGYGRIDYWHDAVDYWTARLEGSQP